MLELAKSADIPAKTAGIIEKLFPYLGIKKEAVEMYVTDIKESNLPEDTKIALILNTKKHFNNIKNQKEIAEIAISNAKEGTDFSGTSKVDEEWLERFMDSAAYVSKEDMQYIWGKVLANEFEKPGSTPPNMIRILSEITSELANSFRLLNSFRVLFIELDVNGDIVSNSFFSRIIIPYDEDDDYFIKCGLNIIALNELEILGLIKYNAFGFSATNVNSEKLLMIVEDKLEAIEKHPKGLVGIGNILLTHAGEALASITQPLEIEGYCDTVKQYLSRHEVVFADDCGYYIDNNSVLRKKSEQ